MVQRGKMSRLATHPRYALILIIVRPVHTIEQHRLEKGFHRLNALFGYRVRTLPYFKKLAKIERIMLEYNEITPKKYIVIEGEPYEVLTSHVFRKQMRKPVNHTKLKSLLSGKVTERSFGQSEKADEADIDTRNIKYLYENRGEYWFCEENNPAKRFTLTAAVLGDGAKFMRQDSTVEALIFHLDDAERTIGIKLPIKVELKVSDAPPNVKGNTAQGGNKQVTVETGAVVNVPMFINEGDVIRINTDTGEYVERVR